MNPITVTELRSNIYNLLDEVLATGVPLEVSKGGRKLRIIPVEPVGKFANMVFRPDVINGDPADLVHILMPDGEWTRIGYDSNELIEGKLAQEISFSSQSHDGGKRYGCSTIVCDRFNQGYRSPATAEPSRIGSI